MLRMALSKSLCTLHLPECLPEELASSGVSMP